MTPGEFKNGGENLHINYSYASSPFVEDESEAFSGLKNIFPKAVFSQIGDIFQQDALYIFTND